MLNGGGRDVEFGVASFVDKPVNPYGSTGDYVYETNLAITGDKAAVQATLDGLAVNDGYDAPESQIEALMQLALRADDDVGFRTGAQRIVVISTDAPPHVAGDYASAPDGANDGDNVIEDEDYPTVEQLRDALEAADITPIFSVTSDQISTYEALVAELGRGVVVEISSDSSNIAAAVIKGLKDVTSTDTATITATVVGTDDGSNDDHCGGGWGGHHGGGHHGGGRGHGRSHDDWYRSGHDGHDRHGGSDDGGHHRFADTGNGWHDGPMFFMDDLIFA